MAQKNSEAHAMPSIPVTSAVSSSPTDQYTEVPMPKDHSLAATRLRRIATSAVIPFIIEEVARHVMLHVETVEKRDILERYAC